LGNTQFTDKLISEHLRRGQSFSKEGQKYTKFAPRDESSYRDFVMRTYSSKDQEDPFSHFYIKESGKIERVRKLHNEATEKYDDIINNHSDRTVVEKTRGALKTL